MKKILFSLLMLMLFTSVYAYDCPANSYMNYDGWCSCNDWYTPNRNWDWCAKVTESLCYEKYWNFSRMASDWSKCTCLSWYGINANGTSCEKITDSFCKSFMSDLVANKDWTDCMCKDGYSLDPDWKHCSKITDEWCEYMWPNAVLDKVEWENYRCKCKDWYHLQKNWLICEENTK